MKGTMIWKGFIGMFIVVNTPQCMMAKSIYPAKQITSEIAAISYPTDSVPPPKKIIETPADKSVSNDKPVAKVIKVVPKARRQPIPIPVKVGIKPVKIIKPKIIKPVIRALH